MTNVDLMNFWTESANEDYDTMMYMKVGKKILGACLWGKW